MFPLRDFNSALNNWPAERNIRILPMNRFQRQICENIHFLKENFLWVASILRTLEWTDIVTKIIINVIKAPGLLIVKH